MFRRVVLDNFKSFGHIEFDLSGPRGKPLGYATVVGGNGSGKTNLIESFQFLVDSTKTLSYGKDFENVTSGTFYFDEMHEIPRKLSMSIAGKIAMFLQEQWWRERMSYGIVNLAGESKTADTDGGMKLEYTFVLNGSDAIYTMEFGSDNIMVRESLDCRINGRRGNLFTISRNENRVTSMRFHGSFFTDSRHESEIRDRIAKIWGMHTALAILRSYAEDGETVNSNICDTLGYLDGIRIRLRGRPGPYMDLEFGTTSAKNRNLLEAHEDSISEFFSRAFPDFFGAHYDIDEEAGTIRYELMFERRIGGTRKNIPATQESFGVRNLLKVLPYLLDFANGKTVLIDELDTGIHTNVIQDLMREVLDTDEGQLILTTHNTAVLQDIGPRNAFVIRRIGYEGKEIVPFNSLARTQKNNNNEDRYRNGVFGGAPVVSFVDMKEIAEASRKIAGKA